jgi:hypothetical protein
MLEVIRELVDAVAGLKGISGTQQADLHARLDAETAPEEPVKVTKVKADDGPAPA